MIKKIKTIFYTVDILYSLAIAMFSTIIYLYMENIGYSLNDINLFISLFWVISFITEIPSGVLSDSFGRRNITIMSCVVRGVGLFLIFISNDNIIFLVLSAILTATGSSLFSGSLSSWAIDEIKKYDENYDFNQLFSKSSLLSTPIAMLGGYIGAQLIAPYNIGYPILISVVLLFVTAIFLLFYVENDNKHTKI